MRTESVSVSSWRQIPQRRCALRSDDTDARKEARRCFGRSDRSRLVQARNQALVALGRVVHAADVPADIGTAPEGAGLKAIAHGFARLWGQDDQRKIELEAPLYDALYACCRR